MEAAKTVKQTLKSKTIWFSLLMAVLAFFPPVNEFVSNNPQIQQVIIAVIVAILRFVTKDKITDK